VSHKSRCKTLKTSTFLTWVTRLKCSPLGRGHVTTTMEKSSLLVEGHMTNTKTEASPLGGECMATTISKGRANHALFLLPKMV